jgi:hypothetical protein
MLDTINVEEYKSRTKHDLRYQVSGGRNQGNEAVKLPHPCRVSKLETRIGLGLALKIRALASPNEITSMLRRVHHEHELLNLQSLSAQLIYSNHKPRESCIDLA